ncbi:MAG: hypothetical protein GXY48_05975 [Methanomicrobiales archaeon]|nr:hypothetical protein [Methanomicrobiales archaeon]
MKTRLLFILLIFGSLSFCQIFASTDMDGSNTVPFLCKPVHAVSIEIPDIYGIKMEIPSSVHAGTYVRIVDTVMNREPYSTGQFFLDYYLVNSSSDYPDTRISSHMIENLLPRGQKTLNFTASIPPELTPGMYVVRRSYRSSDNELPSGSESFISGIESDIEVFSHSDEILTGFFPYHEKILNSGENTINAIITNNNIVEPVQTRLSYYLSQTGDIGNELIFVGESEDIYLQPGEETEITTIVNTQGDISSGNYYLIGSFIPFDNYNGDSGLYWVSDVAVMNQESEYKEQIVKQENIQPSVTGPDLTTSKINYPDIMFIGESIKISDSVQNIGDSTAGIVRNEYLLSPYEDGSQGMHLDWWTIHNVKSGEIRSSQETLGIPDRIKPGIYYFSKKITVTSNPAETNIMNNAWIGNKPVRVEYSPTAKIPDLAHVKTIFPCKDPGEVVEIIDTITNIGNACAEDVSVTYYISPYPEFDPSTATYIGICNIPRICVGEQVVQSTTVTIPPELKIGKYFWYSVIDPCSFMPYCGEEMPELDKSNNINIGRLYIGPCVFCRC